MSGCQDVFSCFYEGWRQCGCVDKRKKKGTKERGGGGGGGVKGGGGGGEGARVTPFQTGLEFRVAWVVAAVRRQNRADGAFRADPNRGQWR